MRGLAVKDDERARTRTQQHGDQSSPRSVALRQRKCSAACPQSRAYAEMPAIVRVLLALLLALWVPLQATAALAMGACADHGHAQVVTQPNHRPDISSAQRHHAASASTTACDDPVTQHDSAASSGASADGCTHCTLCAAPAVPFLGEAGSSRGLLVGAAPTALHVPPAIAVVPPDLIHRPPIVAAA